MLPCLTRSVRRRAATSKRIHRTLKVLARDLSGNATYQELSFLYLFICEWNLQEPGPSWN